MFGDTSGYYGGLVDRRTAASREPRTAATSTTLSTDPCVTALAEHGVRPRP